MEGLSNRSAPEASVIPVLAYEDASSAADWLHEAFGFAVRLRIGSHRVQFEHAGGNLIVTDGGPSTTQSRDHQVMVRVTGIDAHCARSREHGAKIVREPETHPYGERQYLAEDFAGHRWVFTETVDDVDPAVWGGTLP
jgi:uncharacterized glyoxalase superfamily protein PhnB